MAAKKPKPKTTTVKEDSGLPHPPSTPIKPGK